MRTIYNLLSVLVIIIIVLLGFYIFDNFYIINNFTSNLFNNLLSGKGYEHITSNAYTRGKNYEYVKITNVTEVKNKTDIINIVYTFLDSGTKSYSYRCDVSYLNCINDSKEILENGDFLSNISNFVHPYNTFNKVNSSFTSSGKITITKQPRYTNSEIAKLEYAVDTIFNNNYDNSKSVEDNIKIFHDYLIYINKYDQSNVNGVSIYKSSYATGALFEGYAVCSGYAEAMSLFLDRLNLQNIRISSKTHTWNLVKINDKWLHLDLTWDDPIMPSGKDTISYKYFLIPYSTLKSFNDDEQKFNKEIYKEAL